MTLGEIKAEALRLCGFEEYVDAQSISAFESDEDWGGLLRAMWGAVNRCMADLETKRVLPLKRASLPAPSGKGTWRRFRYDEIEDLFEVARVVVESDYYVDDDHPFLLEEGGTLRVNGYDDRANYVVLYRPALKRLSADSGDDVEIDVPRALCEAVPYFVKSEIWRADEADEAAEARNFYEAAVEQYAARAEIGHQGIVQAVYGVDLT